jgi:Flp pilus assembly protein TadG
LPALKKRLFERHRAFLLTGGALMARTKQRSRSTDKGQALLETAFILPVILLVSVAIFEFGRAYQTFEVVTNAAREGARVAVLPFTTATDVQTRVVAYLQAGQLPGYASATITVTPTTVVIGATTAAATTVTVAYPFSFMVLNPVARLMDPSTTNFSAPFTLTATAQMRDEVQ